MFSKTHELTLDVSGMTCGNCVGHVTKALEGVKGVKSADVSLEGTAVVRIKDGTPTSALVHAVHEAGYEAKEAA